MNSKPDKKLLDFLKNQIVVENQIVESVKKYVGEINNVVVKEVLTGISLDSAKHADLYTGAISLLTQTPTALNQENLDMEQKLVEKHIKIESDLIQKLETMIPTIEDKKVTFLLEMILSDEKRHHAMLKLVLESIVHAETITEEDWWKMLWEGVPFHGAPGGG